MLVTTGCCRISSIVFSTVSAQNSLGNIERFYVPPTAQRTVGRARRRQEPSLPDNDALPVAASYARYSSDLQHPESIPDQQRRCRDKAQENGYAIATEFEFADEAVSGTKSDREGLNALMAAAEDRLFRVIYFESLSRLARESIITLPILKLLVYVYEIRVVSINDGIDSASDTWETLAAIVSLNNDLYLRALSKMVFRGQEGNVFARISVGDWCFGYKSEPIPGSETGRRGKNAKPRMRYIIDPESSAWVVRIFQWFVEEKRSIQWITRELTKRNAPKDHRSSKPGWHHSYVRRVLCNAKYVGRWSWGKHKNVRNPLNGKIHQKERDETECEKWDREFPELRIISEEIFAQAQDRLAEYADMGSRRPNGQLTGSSSKSSRLTPRHLLSGIVRCGECEGTFHVSGAGGKYLTCQKYGRGSCSCRTKLQRERAERMIIDEIATRVLSNAAWKSAIYEKAVAAFRELSSRLPSELESKQKALSAAEQKISRLLDQVEDGIADPDTRNRLSQRRAERDRLKRELEGLERKTMPLTSPPTMEWVEQQFVNLHGLLSNGGPAAAIALRGLLTGGIVTVHEVKREGRSHHFLRGTFALNTKTVCASLGSSMDSANLETDEPTRNEEIVLEFREPLEAEKICDQVKQMFDDGDTYDEIAAALSCHRNQVTNALRIWHERRGLEPPDGRKHCGRLERETKPKLLADRAKVLWDEGKLIADIGKELGCNHHMAKDAVEHWFKSRGLPVEDGRLRRKRLDQKQSMRNPSASKEASKRPDPPSGSVG